MNIKEIGVANFRSFDSEGVKISLDKKINIFIGKNNTGKSNFLRFLRNLSSAYNDWKKFPHQDIENQYKRNNKNVELIVSLDLSIIWKDLVDVFGKSRLYTFKITLGKNDILDPHPLENIPEHYLLKMQSYYSSAPRQELIKQINSNLITGIKSELSFLQKLIYIPHFREITDIQDVENVFDGKKIISKLFEMKNPRIGEEKNRDKFLRIQNFVRGLLNTQDLIIDIPHDRDRIVLEMNNNRLSLDAYGTGIHELVIICSALTIYDDHVFCIEEPELHLHPELQRKFLEFIKSLDNYFFISTHSNVFIDYKPSLNIYHVSHDGEATRIELAKTDQTSYNILNNLGYKASDLLQSNGILWVEGPSDRIYLKRWIELLEDSFIEGIHYSIMFYGGRLLSHLTFDPEDNELIKLLRINRNAIVIIDRDGFSSKTKLNKTKSRINSEVKNGSCWITKGREIENYLTEKTMLNFLSVYSEVAKYQYNENQKISELIMKYNKKIKYDKNKVGYAEKIVQYIDKDDLNILDLNKRLQHLIKSINLWNDIQL